MNKNTKETIERINKVCVKDVSELCDEELNVEDVFSTVLNAYYFVKPGKSTKKFMKKLARSTADGIKKDLVLSDLKGIDISPCIGWSLFTRIMSLCRKSFNARWFEHQINNIDDDEFDGTLLKKYLGISDKEQVSHVFQLIVHRGREYHLFMSENNYRKLWDEIDSECKNCDMNLPSVDSNYTTFPMFIFDCLDETIISRILLKYIEKDNDLAGYIARVVYYMEPLDALEYSDVAMSYIDLFKFRVFD